jgi:hypothetical protein
MFSAAPINAPLQSMFSAAPINAPLQSMFSAAPINAHPQPIFTAASINAHPQPIFTAASNNAPLLINYDNVTPHVPINLSTVPPANIGQSFHFAGAIPKQRPFETPVPVGNSTDQTRGFNTNELSIILQKQNDISLQLVQGQEKNSLPNKDLKVFDGSDLLMFKTFMLQFERAIETKCASAEDKLLYLEQFTAGKAKTLIQSCNHYDPLIAYNKAKKLLTEEYGNEHKIAMAYIAKLEQWPPITKENPEALNNFSIFLVNCSHYLENMSYNNQLQSPKEILNIIMKLPYKMRDQWRRKCFNLSKSGLNASFNLLVDFVREEAQLLRQPLFGNIADNSRPENKKDKGKSKVLFTETKPEDAPTQFDKKCDYCKKTNHCITTCKFFEVKTQSEKSQWIKKLGLCFSCLKRNHMSKDCNRKLTCKTCNKQHPTILHTSYQNKINFPGHSNFQSPSKEEENVTYSKNNTVRSSTTKVLHPVLSAKIRLPHNNKVITTNIVLDTGSTDCWIDESLLADLDVPLQKTNIKMTTMDKVACHTTVNVLNNLKVCDMDENISFTIPVTYTNKSNKWPFNKEDVPKERDTENYPHLPDLPFQFNGKPIGLLIGLNMPGFFRILRTIEGEENEPFASLYPLGWTLNGPVKGKNDASCRRIKVNHTDLHEQIEQYFSQDFIDNSNELGPSFEDKKWLDRVQSSITKLESNHYEIDLPFIDDDVFFPNNRKQVYNRFVSSIKRFKKKPDCYEGYSKFMKMMLDNKFMEQVPKEEIVTQPGKVWYLTHHGIYHKQKGKLRVVFNCSLKYAGTALNDQLLQGPDLVNNLVGVLLRFREESCAFSADIEKMYYQVKVPKSDRNFLRLFWVHNDNLDDVREFRLLVHVFGAKSSPSVANFALQQLAIPDDNDNENIKNAKKCLLNNFYVDDLLKSVKSKTEAISLINEVKTLAAAGGFNLTSFSSNSKMVLQNLTSQDLSQKLKEIDLLEDHLPADKALGVVWNPNRDTLSFNIKVSTDYTDITKRSILKQLASIYDPLGLASPVLIPAKRIFQETCNLKLLWDDPLPTNLKLKWIKWREDVNKLSNYEISRSLVECPGYGNHELHVFCDGSEIGYGAVVYLKSTNSLGFVNTKLLFSKARLTPLNRNTLKTTPRIELCSAKLGVELAQKVKNELTLELTGEYFWSDSVTVLSYIKSDSKRFHRFVENRVAFIRTYSKPEQWNT